MIHLFRRTAPLLALGAVLAAIPLAQAGEVVIVNLSDSPVQVARQTYRPEGGPSGGGNESVLAYVTPAAFLHWGWYVLKPGESMRGTDAECFYVEDRQGREITWPSKALSLGIVRASRFDEIPLTPKIGVPQQLKDQGYRPVNYRRYAPNTRKLVSGNAYRLTEKTFQIDISSRSLKFLLESYRVPGKIVDFSYNIDKRWAKTQFRIEGDEVTLRGEMEGKQTSPFAARDKAYVRGSLKVTYTIRN